jgi:hypothetical protein
MPCSLTRCPATTMVSLSMTLAELGEAIGLLAERHIANSTGRETCQSRA